MIWGINKFSKKIIRPDYVPVSEFMNFLSRMPDDVTLKQSRYLSIFDEALLKVNVMLNFNPKFNGKLLLKLELKEIGKRINKVEIQ